MWGPVRSFPPQKHCSLCRANDSLQGVTVPYKYAEFRKCTDSFCISLATSKLLVPVCMLLVLL